LLSSKSIIIIFLLNAKSKIIKNVLNAKSNCGCKDTNYIRNDKGKRELLLANISEKRAICTEIICIIQKSYYLCQSKVFAMINTLDHNVFITVNTFEEN